MNSTRPRIILVDDNIAGLTQGRTILKPFYEVYPAPSAGKLFEILENVLPDLILLDVDMPEVSGYEAIKKVKADRRFAGIPVIFLTAKSDTESELEGFNLGAVDYVTKPFSGPRLLKRIEKELAFARQTQELLESHDRIKDYADNLEVKVHEKVETITRLQGAVLAAMTDLVEFRDRGTGGHVMRTQLYLQTLINELSRKKIYSDTISQWNIHDLLSSSQLHDVGKIAVPDNILCKPGPLTPGEFEVMKKHVVVGMETIERIRGHTKEHTFLRHALAIVGAHHERWDGTGYPRGLAGFNIPLEGRLMAIVDVYDALISERPYKKAFSYEKARAIIAEGAGSHFDPVLADVFLGVENELRKYRNGSAPCTERLHGGSGGWWCCW